jgi:NAD(P)H-flavin reductase
VQAPFGRRPCEVTWTEPLGDYRMLGIEDTDGPEPLAGQFYMLSAEHGWGSTAHGGRPYLGRAFSVCRVRERRLDFLLEAIGPGTECLAALAPGDRAWLVGPLGIGFSDPASGDPGVRRLLVGGGIGAAPLVIWSEALARAGAAPAALLGFRSDAYARATELFECDVRLATDDGSAPPSTGPAHHGLVTDLLAEELDAAPAVVYACGPPAMLEAVRAMCVARGTHAQLAMEAGMACGFGACFGCVVRTRDGYRRLCVDGPVVDAADLEEGWE